jgi:hypothetical protein
MADCFESFLFCLRYHVLTLYACADGAGILPNKQGLKKLFHKLFKHTQKIQSHLNGADEKVKIESRVAKES